MVPACCAILARFGCFVANLRTFLRTGHSSAVVYQIGHISGMRGGPKVVPRLALPPKFVLKCFRRGPYQWLRKIPILADFKHFGLCCADFKLSSQRVKVEGRNEPSLRGLQTGPRQNLGWYGKNGFSG